MKTTLHFFTLLFIIALSACVNASEKVPDKPNIVLIMADDLGLFRHRLLRQ